VDNFWGQIGYFFGLSEVRQFKRKRQERRKLPRGAARRSGQGHVRPGTVILIFTVVLFGWFVISFALSA
jgi:hypothetical protein